MKNTNLLYRFPVIAFLMLASFCVHAKTEHQSEVQDTIKTIQIVPNPFSSEVIITVSEDFDDQALLNIYDPLGNLLRSYGTELMDTPKSFRLVWDGSFKEGMYFFEVVCNGQVFRQRVFFVPN